MESSAWGKYVEETFAMKDYPACKQLLRALPHACIILATLFITLFITDRFNRAMAFINNDLTRWLLLLCGLLFLLQGALAWKRTSVLWARLLSLFCMVESVGLLVVLFIDRNRRMSGILNREITKWGLLLLCLSVIAEAFLLLRLYSHDHRKS